jgi:microcystin-dependent protein
VRWLICNGRAISRSQYQTLFGVIGTEYGAGDGSTTFNIPNLESRVPVGAGQGSGLSNYGIGTSGGEETHSLAMGEMPQHFHTIVDPGHAHDITASVTDNGHTHSLGSPPDATHYDVAVNPGGAAWAAQHFPIGQPSDPIGIYNNNFANQNINGTLSSLTGISVAASSDLKYALGAANVNTLLAGNNLPHNNIQPYLVVSFIIKVV